MADGLPQFFPPEMNLGMVESIQRSFMEFDLADAETSAEALSNIDEAFLDVAMVTCANGYTRSQYPDPSTGQYSCNIRACPKGLGDLTCSGPDHGKCTTSGFRECICAPGYAPPNCAEFSKAPTVIMTLAPSTMSPTNTRTPTNPDETFAPSPDPTSSPSYAPTHLPTAENQVTTSLTLEIEGDERCPCYDQAQKEIFEINLARQLNLTFDVVKIDCPEPLGPEACQMMSVNGRRLTDSMVLDEVSFHMVNSPRFASSTRAATNALTQSYKLAAASRRMLSTSSTFTFRIVITPSDAGAASKIESDLETISSGDTIGEYTVATLVPTAAPTTAAPSSAPSSAPSAQPTAGPTASPTNAPTFSPTTQPTTSPSSLPTTRPTVAPSFLPTSAPSSAPSSSPTTTMPTVTPTGVPTASPSASPTAVPTVSPTNAPTEAPTSPTATPTASPSFSPSFAPTSSPSTLPTFSPSMSPTTANPTFSPVTETPTTSAPTLAPTTSTPSSMPSVAPTTASPTLAQCDNGVQDASETDVDCGGPECKECATGEQCAVAGDCEGGVCIANICATSAPTTSGPTASPSASPSTTPTASPSGSPSEEPTFMPSGSPSTEPTTSVPSEAPTTSPSAMPTAAPSATPTVDPTSLPTGTPTTSAPSSSPSDSPTGNPTQAPTTSPSFSPSSAPSQAPSLLPTTATPTSMPSGSPTTAKPTSSPSFAPTSSPSNSPSEVPSASPSSSPTTGSPTVSPTVAPSASPTVSPTIAPSTSPSVSPTLTPTASPTCSGGCSGNGECSVELGRCICDDGFKGVDCDALSCPGYSANVTASDECTKSLQAGSCDSTSGVCQCERGFAGEKCNKEVALGLPDDRVAAVSIVWGISSVDRSAGIDGEIEYQVEGTKTRKGAKVGDVSIGKPSGMTRTKGMAFNMADPAAQLHIWRACRAFEYKSSKYPYGTLPLTDRENEGGLEVRRLDRCAFDYFKEFVEKSLNMSFPVPEVSFYDVFNRWIITNKNGNTIANGWKDFGFRCYEKSGKGKKRKANPCTSKKKDCTCDLTLEEFDYKKKCAHSQASQTLTDGTDSDLVDGAQPHDCKAKYEGWAPVESITYHRIQVLSALNQLMGAGAAHSKFEMWEEAVSKRINANFCQRCDASAAGGSRLCASCNEAGSDDDKEGVLQAQQLSPLWGRIVTEKAAIDGTISALVTSVCSAFVAILIFVGNLQIAVFCTLAIICIVAALMGFMLVVMQWKFGAIEAISVTIFVGFSVDYQLHLANSYSESLAKTRYGRTRDALTQTGISVVSAAITTIGAAVFLFFCKILVFTNFGVVIAANTVLAIVFALFFLSPLLFAMGPNGHGFLGCGSSHEHKNRLKKTKTNKLAQVKPEVSGDPLAAGTRLGEALAQSAGHNVAEHEVDSVMKEALEHQVAHKSGPNQ